MNARSVMIAAVLWTAGTAPLGAGTEPALTTFRVASGLQSPLFVTHAPGDSERLFILQQTGQILILRDGAVLDTPFLDVNPLSGCCDEEGLLGLAFHPGYHKNGTFFINYTDNSGDTVVARYTVSANPDVANPEGDIIFTIGQPFANHNAGWLDFGPDGMLYLPLGDGGWFNDPQNRAQDITNQLLGKMLRIDVDGDDFPADPNRDYAIPLDNPFVGITGDDEIWAYGLRNPWRNSFDRVTGDLYIADVGQDAVEEINLELAGSAGGRNYGWRCTEGTSCPGLSGCTCNGPTLTPPVHTYGHPGGNCSVTGGYVYRGAAMPELDGTYFFADFCSARIWSTVPDNGAFGPVVQRTGELAPGGTLNIGFISSFGEDADGELYIVDLGGEIFKIIPVEPLHLTASEPPAESIDARQPLDSAGAPQGLTTFILTFDGNSTALTPSDFALTEQGGMGTPPAVVSVTPLDTHVIRLRVAPRITAGAWTTLTYLDTATSVRVGFLPGDVNGNGTTSAVDILALIDHLNGVLDLPLASTDIDRNGVTTPLDILRLIDVLNGAGDLDPWNGVSLP